MTNYAFIDSNNLYLGIKEQGWKLDFAKFRQYLFDKFQVSKAFIFLGYLQTNTDLYKSLQESGYILIFKPTLNIRGTIKGNADAELVLQAMIEFDQYNQAIIVTGDGDFHCLIKYLCGHNKLRKLILPNKDRYSSLLRHFSAYSMSMNGLRLKLEHKKEA